MRLMLMRETAHENEFIKQNGSESPVKTNSETQKTWYREFYEKFVKCGVSSFSSLGLNKLNIEMKIWLS